MDSKWAHKRRTRVTFIIVSLAFVALALYILVKTYEPASCFDNKKNQDEIGIDCGGSCELLCSSQVSTPRLLWARLFEIEEGKWSAFAYLDNANFNAFAPQAEYRFTVYDAGGAVIGEKEGTTFVTSKPVLPVFADDVKIQSGEVPGRVAFEWTGGLGWYTKKHEYQLAVEERRVVETRFGSEVQAVLHNKEPIPVTDVEVLVVVYDANKNAIAVSRTYVDTIGPRQKKKLTFSWPEPFSSKAERLEFHPRVPEREQ